MTDLSLFRALAISGLVYAGLLGNSSPSAVFDMYLPVSLTSIFTVLPVFLLVSAVGFSLAAGRQSFHGRGSLVSVLSTGCVGGDFSGLFLQVASF